MQPPSLPTLGAMVGVVCVAIVVAARRGPRAGDQRSVLAHAKTPEPLAAKLSDDFRQVLARPDVAAKLAETGNYVRPMTRPEVTAFIKREREIWGAVIKTLGFTPR